MSTASIKRPLIITSDKSANIIANVLESKAKRTDFGKPLVAIEEIKEKSVLSFLKTAK